MTKLKAPFPYFGGKSQVASLVWHRLGNPRNYVEPFAGSLAMLLRRPHVGKVETVNDQNHYLVNFWRAVRSDPEGVADHADWPVTEADLHARHRFLTSSEFAGARLASVVDDPEFFDARIAGWWVWGQCCWIGSGWCDRGQDSSEGRSLQVSDLAGLRGVFGRGVLASSGHTKRPVLRCDSSSRGVVTLGRPQLGDAYDIGRGVNGNRSAGTCRQRREWLLEWIGQLADRLRLVRICYGHWDRICDSNTTMTRLGETGAFLDPPYAHDCQRVAQWRDHLQGDGPVPKPGKATNRAKKLYAGDADQDIDRLVAEVNLWCLKWGSRGEVRIALCGYQGEHDNLEGAGWECVPWKAQGGYGNRNADNVNAHRERLWFSPACDRETQLGLF